MKQRGLIHVAGVGEAASGPLAGPVVSPAVILPPAWQEGGFDERLRDLNDSKQLTEAQREAFFAILTAHPEIRFGIATVDAAVIDRINILQATHRAMNEALAQLQRRRNTCLMIAKKLPDTAVPMSLLADHPNVQFNYYRKGLGTCEVAMH